MAEINVGFDQSGKPAPLYWRRLTTAVVVLVPIIMDIVNGWGGISDATLNHITLIVTHIPAAIVLIGKILGNGQEYAPKGTSSALMQMVPEADTTKEAVSQVLGKGRLNEPVKPEYDANPAPENK